MSNSLTEFTACECGHEVSIPPHTHGTKCYKCGAWVESKVIATTPEPVPDMVKHPPHYTVMDPQPKELCVQLPFLEGSIVKYVCRHTHKGGLQDLQKAMEWLEILIAREYPEDE